jgi:predicted DNA binding CopG/RHH family protein
MPRLEVPVKRKIALDSFEKQVESALHSYVPISGAKRRKIQAVLEATRKTKNINIRISHQDLESLRHSAEQEGIPYQTLISSVLHKYLAGRLVDEVSIRKSVEILSRKARTKAS